MYALRRTAMRHGIFTDALTRFNKGQSPAQTDPVLKQLMSVVGGVQASPMLFKNCQSLRSIVVGGMQWCGGLLVPSGSVEARLGVNFADGEMDTLLGNVEFLIDEGREYGEDGMMVYSPFWRTDIELPEDIVEEVGRLYGFDKLPRQLPRRSIKPAPKNLRRELKNAVRQSLSRAGANEVLTYSFVHERILKNAEQDVAQAYKLSNALSPDLQYYRLTVLPSLLDKVHANIKAGHDEFALFEMGKGHIKMHGLGEDGLPEASQFTDIVYAAKKSGAGAPFYMIRRLVERLARDLGAELVFKPIEQELNFPVTAPFDQSRSALVETTDGTFIGIVGELKQSVIKNFKLPAYVAAASLDTAGLEAVYAKQGSYYRPLSRYPSTSRDISMKLPSTVRYQQLLQTLDEVVRDVAMEVRIEPLTIYRSEDDAAQKTITWRLTFTSHARTLVDKDIAPVMQQIERVAKDAWGAEVV